MRPGCPPLEMLLLIGLRRDQESGAAEHVSRCPQCQDKIRHLRDAAASLQVSSDTVQDEVHATADTLAALAEGNVAAVPASELDHVAECAECRSQLAMLSQTLEDPDVAAELRTLEARAIPRSSRLSLPWLGGLAAAAAAAIVLVGPIRSRETATHRESAITTTEAPRALAPIEAASPGDSLRWTTLPQADLYRVRIWNAEGVVVWSAETRDTVAVLPPMLTPATQYLWEVRARTGWDRWVGTDLIPFSLRPR